MLYGTDGFTSLLLPFGTLPEHSGAKKKKPADGKPLEHINSRAVLLFTPVVTCEIRVAAKLSVPQLFLKSQILCSNSTQISSACMTQLSPNYPSPTRAHHNFFLEAAAVVQRMHRIPTPSSSCVSVSPFSWYALKFCERTPLGKELPLLDLRISCVFSEDSARHVTWYTCVQKKATTETFWRATGSKQMQHFPLPPVVVVALAAWLGSLLRLGVWALWSTPCINPSSRFPTKIAWRASARYLIDKFTQSACKYSQEKSMSRDSKQD